MAPILLVAAIALLALPGAAWRFGRRLQPSEWSWFCVKTSQVVISRGLLQAP